MKQKISCLRILIFLFALFESIYFCNPVYPQYTGSDTSVFEVFNSFNNIYGPDLNLVNGQKYFEHLTGIEGHPFLGENKFNSATIYIRGEKYSDTNIKYDIYNQHVILEYNSSQIGKQLIIVPDENLERFILNDHLFEYRDIPEIGRKLFQIVNEGKYSCAYFWSKKYMIPPASPAKLFTQEIVKFYIFYNDVYFIFRNNKSFIKIFPDYIQLDIRNYLKSLKLNVKTISTSDMKVLMDFINSLN